MRRERLLRVGAGGWAALLIALVGGVLFAAPAQAAPQYRDSEPNDGASVQAPPGIVSVSFNEPLDESSTMSIANECGERVDGGHVAVDLDEMRVDLVERHYSGTYIVSYTAVGVGGVTGTTRGSFSFNSAEGHPCGDDGHPAGHGNHEGMGHGGHGNHGGMGHGGHGNHGGMQHGGHMGHGEHGSMNHGEHAGMDHASHAGMDHGSMDHASMDHASMDHASMDHGGMDMSGEHSSHDMSSGHEGMDMNGRSSHHDMAHMNHGSPAGDSAAGFLGTGRPDGRAVLLALALCAGMGLVGGVFLRSSSAA